jgi:hypothetical protein
MDPNGRLSRLGKGSTWAGGQMFRGRHTQARSLTHHAEKYVLIATRERNNGETKLRFLQLRSICTAASCVATPSSSSSRLCTWVAPYPSAPIWVGSAQKRGHDVIRDSIPVSGAIDYTRTTY